MSVTFYFKDPCPKCSKPIMYAVVEPDPSCRDLALHKLHCADCGPIKTILLSLKPVKPPPGTGSTAARRQQFDGASV
jgi:hypothetical protein